MHHSRDSLNKVEIACEIKLQLKDEANWHEPHTSLYKNKIITHLELVPRPFSKQSHSNESTEPTTILLRQLQLFQVTSFSPLLSQRVSELRSTKSLYHGTRVMIVSMMLVLYVADTGLIFCIPYFSRTSPGANLNA